MFLAVAIFLVIFWLLGVFVARVASALIHVIIILAILAFAAHVVHGGHTRYFDHRASWHERQSYP